MDIAEIRKKAKSQDKVDDLNCEPVTEQTADRAPVDQEEQQGSEGIAAFVDDLTVVEDTLASTQQVADGLDQLFAATEEFALTTDESYADVLDSQTESLGKSSCQYLAFHLCDEEYALDIARISEIIKVREFTDIPRAPEFILGIISLRGVVVPVFDLRLRLKLGASELTSASRIVVCQLDDVTVGLLVDSINQVVHLTEDDIEPPPGVLSGLDREMVSGIGRYQGRMIILLNIQNALNVELIQE
jgi:purine-binding chemotaxis protein CheW